MAAAARGHDRGCPVELGQLRPGQHPELIAGRELLQFPGVRPFVPGHLPGGGHRLLPGLELLEHGDGVELVACVRPEVWLLP